MKGPESGPPRIADENVEPAKSVDDPVDRRCQGRLLRQVDAQRNRIGRARLQQFIDEIGHPFWIASGHGNACAFPRQRKGRSTPQAA